MPTQNNTLGAKFNKLPIGGVISIPESAWTAEVAEYLGTWKLSGNAKFVGLMVAVWTLPDGWCRYPIRNRGPGARYRSIADRLGLPDGSVAKAVAELKSVGLIESLGQRKSGLSLRKRPSSGSHQDPALDPTRIQQGAKLDPTRIFAGSHQDHPLTSKELVREDLDLRESANPEDQVTSETSHALSRNPSEFPLTLENLEDEKLAPFFEQYARLAQRSGVGVTEGGFLEEIEKLASKAKTDAPWIAAKLNRQEPTSVVHDWLRGNVSYIAAHPKTATTDANGWRPSPAPCPRCGEVGSVEEKLDLQNLRKGCCEKCAWEGQLV